MKLFPWFRQEEKARPPVMLEGSCPGCRPVFTDPNPPFIKLPENHPVAQMMNRVWEATTLKERQALHRVTCQKSKAMNDLLLVRGVWKRFEKAANDYFK